MKKDITITMDWNEIRQAISMWLYEKEYKMGDDVHWKKDETSGTGAIKIVVKVTEE